MNEKIKELRRQAIDYCLDRGSQGNLSEEVSEKFAELIVQECARLAAATPCPYVVDDRMMQHIGHTWDMACVAAAKEIRENLKVK